jgi:hypothetical protein
LQRTLTTPNVTLTSARSRSSAATRRQASAVAALIAFLIAWIPLQTPIAILAFQYGGVSVEVARAILLAKDVMVALLIVYLFVTHWREVRLAWWDYFAIAYVVLLGIYTVVPWALGSRLPAAAVLASLREFLVPVELYALGRLAVIGGIELRPIIIWFLAVAAATAAFTVLFYLFVPVQFWSSTLDLVTFERVVQGIPTANTLWDISLLGQYGVSDSGTFPRAIGPFTHPVGTAHYFVVPLILAVAASFRYWNLRDRRAALVAGALVILLAAAIITPISRGNWIAAAVGVLLLGLAYRRLIPSFIALAVVAAFIVAVPPFSYSITSALQGSDSSIVGHQIAIQDGLHTVQQNPGGLGVGQADHFGEALSGGTADDGTASAGIGENMYLAILASVGPLGLIAFLGWMIGLMVALFRRSGGLRSADWMAIGTGATLVAFSVSALSGSPLMRFTTSASFWLLVGLFVAVRIRDIGAAQPGVESQASSK